MTCFVSNTAAPTVLIVGRKDAEGHWHYLVSESQLYYAAMNQLSIYRERIRLSANPNDWTAFARDAHDPEVLDYRRKP